MNASTKLQPSAAQKTVKAIRAGEFTVRIASPKSEPLRRETYLSVNAAAYRVLGSKEYSIKQMADHILIKRRTMDA